MFSKITEMGLIRIVVNPGRGFGHQRAAITLMQKLMEMGFEGVFDVLCYDKIGQRIFDFSTGKYYINQKPLVSSQLIKMIPDLEHLILNSPESKLVKGLGKLRISSLPNDFRNNSSFKLERADLAACAADDSFYDKHLMSKQIQIFNAASYIGLQPTNWSSQQCFVTNNDGTVVILPSTSETRLSSTAAYQLPDISSITLSDTEKKIIPEVVSNFKINSQLVYGLYSNNKFSQMSEPSSNKYLNEIVELSMIVKANSILSNETQKPSILILPQETVYLKAKDYLPFVINDQLKIVNLKENNLNISNYRAGDVVIAYTGHLQQPVFDYLLSATTLPPVIEGCNSMELCESIGIPYLHGSDPLSCPKRYEVELNKKQDLHLEASRCLEKERYENEGHIGGQYKHFEQLLQYMRESLIPNSDLIEYHKQRKEEFLKRKDVCELAFDTLGIHYTKNKCDESSSVLENPQAVKASNPRGRCTVV